MRSRHGCRFGWRLSCAVATGLLMAACRPNMLDQPRIDPFEPSSVFADGASARLPVPETIARGTLRTGTPAPAVPVTLDGLRRGRERFDIFCSPCHSRTGDGDGMVVLRGFRQPPSLFEARLMEAPPGYLFDVITNGIGAMPSFAYLVPAEDRWAIIGYVRALQRSTQAEDRNVAAPPQRPGAP